MPDLSYTPSFVYNHGWRDIVNKVSFDVQERVADAIYSDVWTSEDSISLSSGEAREITVSTSDPFIDAITPETPADFTVAGAGTVSVVMSRGSGQSTKITFLAVGGSVIISNLRLRAKLVPVQRTIKITQTSPGSVSQHGERSYPNDAPWANVNDAEAIASMILLHYAERRPTIQLRVTSQDPEHFLQVLQRTMSDRIHVVNGEMGLDADFFVERITHTIKRINQDGKPPVHAVVLGCEKDLVLSTNPFTFDKRGAGFDDGVFDPIQADDANTVFIFDDPVQGQFDTGLFGT